MINQFIKGGSTVTIYYMKDRDVIADSYTIEKEARLEIMGDYIMLSSLTDEVFTILALVTKDHLININVG